MESLLVSEMAPEGSPFHEGELAVQARLGVLARTERPARRSIRDFMPPQHQAFFGQLPFVLAGMCDASGQPWASILAAPPGFMVAADARHLAIHASAPYADPLHETLQAGAPIGLLGIEPHTRRRNRLNGRIAQHDAAGLVVEVDQSFGNCPQYIQAREAHFTPTDVGVPPPTVRQLDYLDDAMRRLIGSADTLYIASSYDAGQPAAIPDPGATSSHGVDVSHRGGKPGFVLIDGERTLVIPDFVGNFFFNTIGNLVQQPRAGLLFIDFASGDLLYLAVTVEVVWDGPEVKSFEGAERLLKCRISAARLVEGSLPLRWGAPQLSPFLARTGTWEQAARNRALAAQRNVYRRMRVIDVETHSSVIRSLTLAPVDGAGVAPHEAGQFLPIRVQLPGAAQPMARTYTLSDAPNGRTYRLSIKRGAPGGVSQWLHDQAEAGTEFDALAPRGSFTLDLTSAQPLVLLSAGVGVTPMIAMLNALLVNDGRSRYAHPIHFIHGARDGAQQAFGAHLHALAQRHANLRVHVRFSAPGAADRLGGNHDSIGHIDIALLKSLLPLDDYLFYLCGPRAFMQELYEGLLSLGVRPARIHYEAFVPGTALQAPAGAAPAPASAEESVAVNFVRSAKQVRWTERDGSLLDLALAHGLHPPFSCRSGVCGTCAHRVLGGALRYVEQPLEQTLAELAPDNALICCAQPLPGPAGDGVSLDL